MTTVTVTWRLYTFPKTKAIDDEDNLKVFKVVSLSKIFLIITKFSV